MCTSDRDALNMTLYSVYYIGAVNYYFLPGSDIEPATTPRQAEGMAFALPQPQAAADVSPAARRCVAILYAVLHGNSGSIQSRASLFLSTLLDAARPPRCSRHSPRVIQRKSDSRCL